MGTILVVDDDPDFVEQAQRMLGGAGYHILLAADGVRATRVREEMRGKIDLAIVDLALPGLNGFELIGALSRRPNSVKIIATSAVYKERQLESATALGAHAALRKPPNPKTLNREQWLSAVAQLIGAP